jgi:hypothetical protein
MACPACNDNDACTDDSCDSVGACTHVARTGCGVDAGTDAGVRDAGTSSGSDAGTTMMPITQGCGCSSLEGALATVLGALLLRRRRKTS